MVDTLVNDEFDDDDELSWEEQQEFNKIVESNFCGTQTILKNLPAWDIDGSGKSYKPGGIVPGGYPAGTSVPHWDDNNAWQPWNPATYPPYTFPYVLPNTQTVTITTTDTSEESIVGESEDDIIEECEALKNLLLEKNRKYGDSALNPSRIFSRSDAVEQIKVRIDDKLTRLKNAQSDEDEDVVQDLLGYLILLRIAKKRAVTSDFSQN